MTQDEQNKLKEFLLLDQYLDAKHEELGSVSISNFPINRNIISAV